MLFDILGLAKDRGGAVDITLINEIQWTNSSQFPGSSRPHSFMTSMFTQVPKLTMDKGTDSTLPSTVESCRARGVRSLAASLSVKSAIFPAPPYLKILTTSMVAMSLIWPEAMRSSMTWDRFLLPSPVL